MKIPTKQGKLLQFTTLLLGFVFLFGAVSIARLQNPLDYPISLVGYLSLMFACYASILYIFFVFSNTSKKESRDSKSQIGLSEFLFKNTKRSHFQSNLKFFFIFTLVLSFITQGIFFSMPAYFNDFFRYLWDGKMFIHGINPFAFFPWAIHDTPELHNLSLVWYWDIMYFKWTYTIYPPFLQFVFALSNTIKEDSAYVLKAIFFGFNIGSVYFGLKLLQHLKKNILFIAFLILNPLFLFETMSTAHTESVIIFCLLSTLYFFVKNRYFLAGILFAALILTKFFPLALIPLFFIYLYKKKYKISTFFTFFGMTFLGLFLFYLPFFFGVQIPFLYESLQNFSKEWTLSPGIFQVLLSLSNALHIASPYILAKKLSVLLMVLSIFSVYFAFYKGKQIDENRLIVFSSLIFLCIILFSSIVASWYILWLIAFTPFIRNRFFILALSFTITFQYLLIYFDKIEHNTYKYIENGQIFSHQVLVWLPPLLFTLYFYTRKKIINLCRHR